MCGRFYIDDDTAREIEKTIRKVDGQMRRERDDAYAGAHPIDSACMDNVRCAAGDIYPSDVAAVITMPQNEVTSAVQRWGFPGFGTQKLIINARSETVLEKPMFRESVLTRRIIIPARGFYEWNSQREKAVFTSREKPVLYMAGFYNRIAGEDRFVILTTRANESMKSVHDRMPLLFEEEELEEWLRNARRLEELLRKIPQQLKRHMEYEQQRLNF